MNKILKTSVASVFAAACLAGASVTFAADNNGGGNGGNAGNGGNSSHSQGGVDDANIQNTDPSQTNSINDCKDGTPAENCMTTEEKTQQQ